MGGGEKVDDLKGSCTWGHLWYKVTEEKSRSKKIDSVVKSELDQHCKLYSGMVSSTGHTIQSGISYIGTQACKYSTHPHTIQYFSHRSTTVCSVTHINIFRSYTHTHGMAVWMCENMGSVLCQSTSRQPFLGVSATAALPRANTSPCGIVIFHQSFSPGLLHGPVFARVGYNVKT